MHIYAEYWLLEHFEKPETSIIFHVIARNSESNILSLTCFGGRTDICRIQSALKVIILHQYT